MTPSTDALRAALSQAETYPEPPRDLRVEETHISLVGLAGDHVWKLKKALDLGFLDFSTLDQRRQACEDEVRLNRRLAPDAYPGVVPLVRTDDGRLVLEGSGEVVEWAVKMRRLDDADRLGNQLDQVTAGTLERLGRHIASFHQGADRSDAITAMATPLAISRNALENFEQTASHRNETVSNAVWHRLRALTDRALLELGSLMRARADAGRACDGHGDLRLEHVYVHEETFTVLDAVEFSARYRFADPISDVAFLVMELRLAGRDDLASAFVRGWVEGSGDAEALALLPFYVAYRAVVRAKVLGIAALDPGRPEADRASARERARRHWLFALGQLAEPAERPLLLLVGGLPGVGKSTLSRHLDATSRVEVLRSDVVRKELAGLSTEDDASAAFGQGLYTSAWTDRTYDALVHRTAARLEEGGRVLVDASFSKDARRLRFVDLARGYGVPILFVHVDAPVDLVHERIRAREGDASDADVAIHDAARAAWEPPGHRVSAIALAIENTGPPGRVADPVLHWLAEHDLG